MGHRNTFNTPQIIETDNNNGWLCPEQPYLPIESSSTSYPMDNTTIQGGHFPSQWARGARSNGYPSSNLNVEPPYYQGVAHGPSHNPYLDSGNPYMHQDNYSHHPSSSNVGGQTVHGADNRFYDQTILRGRGSYKRKSPIVDLNCEEGHTNWEYEYPPSYGVNAVGNEATVRNVRSKTIIPTSMHASSSRSNSRDWNGNLVSPVADVATFGSNSGGSTYPNTLSNYPNGDVSNRNHIAESSNKSVRGGARSGYGQRSFSTFAPGFIAASDEGQQIVAESYPSRNPRPSSNSRSRSVGRISRNHISSERSAQPGIVVADHSSYYGSRSMADQHRDMRLDIDNMSYEELLALEERIGSVNTGLSDDLISKSLTESIYCSSDLVEDDEVCIICLEEYKNMDDVGILRICGHDFHVGCIRKWLSMKNLCPICKASAIDEGTKGKLKGL